MAPGPLATASAVADIQIDHLSALPTELQLIVAEHLDAAGLASLRATSRQLACNIDATFFKTAHFHVIIDVDHLKGFKELIRRHGNKITKIKLANRILLDTRVISAKRWRGLLGQLGESLPRFADTDREKIGGIIVPPRDVLAQFIELLQALPKLTEMATYNDHLQATFSYPDGVEDYRVLEEVVNIYDAEKEDRARGWPVAVEHQYDEIAPACVWMAAELLSEMYHTALATVPPGSPGPTLLPQLKVLELNLNVSINNFIIEVDGIYVEDLNFFVASCAALEELVINSPGPDMGINAVILDAFVPCTRACSKAICERPDRGTRPPLRITLK